MSSALPFSGWNRAAPRASSHRALLSQGSQVWCNVLGLFSWILNNFVFETVSEVWRDNEAVCEQSRYQAAEGPVGSGSRAHNPDTEQLAWWSGKHPHVWAIQGATRPRLGGVTVAAAEAAAVMALGERKDLGKAVTPGGRTACPSIITAHPCGVCTNI